MNAQTRALIAAARFHALAETAARHGGFWVSAGGGTANVVAGIISRGTGAQYEYCHHALDVTASSDDWYGAMAQAMPWRWDDYHGDCPGRWDAKTVASAAVRPVRA